MTRAPLCRGWLSLWTSLWTLLLLGLLLPPAQAEELLVNRTELAVGESVTVKIPGALGLVKPKWRTNPSGIVEFADKERTEAKVRAVAPGKVQVSATVDWKLSSTTYSVSLCVTSASGPSSCAQAGTAQANTALDSPDWGNGGPALQRLSHDQRRMADLLRNANQALNRGDAPDAVARQFYADLARLNLAEPMVKLNALKTELQKAGLADAALGERFPSAAGTPVERALLVYRRDLTMESIRAAVAEVARSHGTDVGSIFLAKIGKWAIQNPDMFTLAGDIDFSFVGARPEILLALRDAYKRQITERSGGLDMVAIDSVATAHGFAEHMVYMGIQGRKFADDAMMGMNEGVERIDFHTPEATGTPGARQVSGKQALIETVLEETGRRYRENGAEAKGRSLANEIEQTWNDRRNQTVEPMLSMEMARHLEHDIIRNVDVFAAIDIIKKGSKYLRRSNDQTTADLKIDPADAAWARFVVDVDEMAKTAKAEDMVKFIDAETRKLGIAGFEMTLVDGKATLTVAPGAAESFLAKARQMIWRNVSNGMDARIRGLTDALNNRGQAAGPGTPDDLRPERLADTLRMLTAGLEVMKQSHGVIPSDIMTKASVLAKLIQSHGGQRGYSLPAEEIEKLQQLLRESVHNDATLLLKMGTVVSHIDQWLAQHYDSLSAKLPASRQLSLADAKIDTLNALLDAMDDSLLGALREKGVLELDMGTGADGKPRIRALTFPRIAAINQRLNQSVLGRIGNNTAFKAFNLAQEGDAYYSAIMQAGTPWEAFSNVSTEIFRRRVPGGGMVEAYVMENYTRMGIEVVYTLFPPLAVPEGLYGMGASFYEARRQEWWQAELETLIDGLHENAEFAKDSASPGHYPLTHVTYKTVRYSRKGLEEGKSFILDPDVDKALTENLRAGDPFLTLMAELENHGAAGDKVRGHFRAKADQRWIEVKRDFVRHMIDKLEKRHDAEVADLTGQIPELYAELMATAEKLEIRDQVVKRMDAEWDSNTLKSFWTWLKNVGRQGAWGGTLAETERNKAAAIVIRYRDAYRGVLAARERLEAEVARTLENTGQAAQDVTQHKQRLLTGIVFLTGEDARDAQVATQWAGQAGRSEMQVRDELLALKARYLPGAVLDTPFDSTTLGQVFFEDVWIEALAFMKVPVISAASFKRAAETRKTRRAGLVKAFEIHYANQTGSATVRVLHQADKRSAGIERAQVVLKAGQAELRPAHRGEGLYTLTGLAPGSYAVSASAEGYKAADGKPVATAKLTMPPRSDTTRMGEATLLLVPGKTDALTVSIETSPADRRIGSSGPNSQAVLKAHVVGLPDSGKLRFQWAVGDRVLAQGEGRDSATFSGTGHGGKTATVTVLAIDAKDREGQASVDIQVGAAEDIEVKLAPNRSRIGRNQDETIEVLSPSEHGVKYRWTLSEGGSPREFDGDRRWLLNGAYHVGKTVSVGVRATTPDGRTGSASTSVTVLDEDKDKENDKENDKPAGKAKQGAGGSASGQFPGEPFNGMQISYSVSGCSLPKMTDKPGFGTYRTYSGRLGSGSLTVSGAARMGAGYGADLTVSVSAGGKTAEHKAYIKTGWPGFNSETFNLSVPIPPEATSASFNIRMDGSYSMGGGWRGLGVSGSCTADGPEGPSPQATDPLSVTLEGPKDPVPLGKEVEVSANAKGGRFPYGFAWTGASGNAERVKLKIAKPGSQAVSVSVSDSEGQRASASLSLKVAPLKLALAGLSDQVYYGSRSRLEVKGLPDFQAPADPCAGREYTGSNPFDECLRIRNVQSVESGAKSGARPVRPLNTDLAHYIPDPDREDDTPSTASGPYRFVWQSEPGLSFEPATSTDGATWATFDRMGQVKVWCEVHQMIEGAWQSIGETEQKTVNVVAPAFSLEFTPPDGQGKVGQEVRARIVVKPGIPTKLIDYRWFEPGSANRMEYADNAGEIGFKLKDAKPVKLDALARVPHHGDEIAKLTGSYTGVAYDVKIGEPRGTGPQLQVWVCDTQLGNARNCGMKDIPKGQFSTFQDLFLKAEVTPAPSSPRYRWSVDPSGSCGLPGSGSELRMNCSNTGNYTVRLQVLDADNILLGQAERTVGISVSDADVKQAPKSRQAWDKLQQAKQKANAGQLDEAIDLAAVAAGLDAKNTEAKDLDTRWRNERNTVRQQLDRARKAIQANRPDDAQKEIDAARKLHPKYPPVLESEQALAEKRKGAGQAVTGNETGSDAGDHAGKPAGSNIAGTWRTSEGELTLTQRGRSVNGSYNSDGGQIVGEMNGNVLEGYWIENNSGERCATARNGRYHWGKVRWTFEGSKFSGAWSYCDKPLPASGSHWTGERTGDVPPGYVPPSNASTGAASSSGKAVDASSDEEWAVVETTPGMYRLERSAKEAKVARQANNPGGLQYGGLRLNRNLPASGDFSAQVSFADARIDGGLNQIELQATFADGSIFYVVRDRERSGSHIWAPNLQGDASCGKAGTLGMDRRGNTVTGYCDGRAIWSAPRKAALTRLQFVLQNNGTNDPISVTFRDWRFSASASTASASGLAGTWSINANGYTGKLELNESGGHIAGRVWFDAHRVWEDLGDFSFDGRTLRFLRPGPNQRYTGTYSGNEVRGSFDGGGSWNWSMTRTGAAAAVPTTLPLAGQTPKRGAPSTAQTMSRESRLKLVDQIPSTDSARFRGNLRSDLVMHTGSWDRTPYFMAPPQEFELNLKRIDRACLAGDAKGGSGWRVDNYLLIELFDSSGRLIKDGVIGGHEGVSRNGKRVSELGNGHEQGPCAVNLKSFLPVGQPFRMKVSAMDYGGVGYVSDVWLLLEGEVTGSALETPGGRDYTYQPGGRDYTSDDRPVTVPVDPSGTGYLRIEACVDGSDWISLDNGRLKHQHRAFSQIGTHDGCPASHRVAGGGFLVDGLAVALSRLPMAVGMAGIGRFEVERGRGHVHLDGANRLLIDDDGPGGSDVYILRLYPGATGTATGASTTAVPVIPGGRDYTAAPVQGSQVLFEVGNIGGVRNGPTQATRFTLNTPHVITLIQDYHWNSGRGAPPGSIALKGKDGRLHGPWPTRGSPGQGGVPNAYWTAYPNVTLPAGTYTVIDSDPASWAHNAESGNRGFVRVEGHGAESGSASSVPTTGNAEVDSMIKDVDGLLDAVKSLKGLFGQ